MFPLALGLQWMLLQISCRWATTLWRRSWVANLAATGILNWGSRQDFCGGQPSSGILPGWEISHVPSFSPLLLSEGSWHILCCYCPASWSLMSPSGWPLYLHTPSQPEFELIACAVKVECGGSVRGGGVCVVLSGFWGRVGNSEGSWKHGNPPGAPEVFGGSKGQQELFCDKIFVVCPCTEVNIELKIRQITSAFKKQYHCCLGNFREGGVAVLRLGWAALCIRRWLAREGAFWDRRFWLKLSISCFVGLPSSSLVLSPNELNYYKHKRQKTSTPRFIISFYKIPLTILSWRTIKMSCFLWFTTWYVVSFLKNQTKVLEKKKIEKKSRGEKPARQINPLHSNK